MKRKWFIVTTTACVLFGTSVMAFASNPIKLMINDTEHYTEVPPQIMNGRVMVPLSVISDVFGKETTYDKHAKNVNIKNIQHVTIAESESGEMKVTADQGENGIYEHLTLVTENFSQNLLGSYNVINPSYAPEILLADVNGDGKDEIVIILTTGYGTGVYQSEVRVLEGNTGHGIHTENALSVFSKQFSEGNLTAKGIEFDLNKQHILIPDAEVSAVYKDGNQKIEVGSIIRYEVENNILKATTAVPRLFSDYAGELQVQYVFKDNVLQGGTASFIPYED
ncbi:MAG TPA: stalk domain-containing protein [Paenibacillus sp.]